MSSERVETTRRKRYPFLRQIVQFLPSCSDVNEKKRRHTSRKKNGKTNESTGEAACFRVKSAKCAWISRVEVANPTESVFLAGEHDELELLASR